MVQRVCVLRLLGEAMAPGFTLGQRQVGGGIVVLWAVFCLDKLGLAIHVDVNLICETYLKIAAHQIHSMTVVCHGGSGLFQQDYAPKWHTLFWNGLKNVMRSSRCCPDLRIPQISNQLWDVLDQRHVRSTAAPPCKLQDLKNLLL